MPASDEFYTQYADVENELKHYANQFKGKRIVCPCDWDDVWLNHIVSEREEWIQPSCLFDDGGYVRKIDIERSLPTVDNLPPAKSAFVRYFIKHGKELGIKSLHVSGYDIASNSGVRFQDVDYSKYDVVATNPPFSQFKEFIETLAAGKGDFIVISPINAIKYKDTFPYIKSGRINIGTQRPREFITTDGESGVASIWFTSFIPPPKPFVSLTKRYSGYDNPAYNEMRAIDIKSVADIPCDYDGIMGVPVTFVEKWNREQFEVLRVNSPTGGNFTLQTNSGVPPMVFDRILIRRLPSKV